MQQARVIAQRINGRCHEELWLEVAKSLSFLKDWWQQGQPHSAEMFLRVRSVACLQVLGCTTQVLGTVF